MQIDETNIIYIIVYNIWTTEIPLKGRTSPVAPFLSQDMKSYGKKSIPLYAFHTVIIFTVLIVNSYDIQVKN